MNRAFIYGFLDEMDKGASVVERAADMLKDVKEHVAAGHKKRGLTGAAIGLEKGLRANPWLMLAPAGVYAGSKLLKGILNFGKREDER